MVTPISRPATALPRIVIAAPASGHGKTTLATGIMAALTRRGLAVAPAKVGPDYIDPGYHSLATGRPGRNLDPHLCGEELMVPLLLHGAAGADIAVIEGVMGLYDGALGRAGFGGTAHVAELTQSPVLLCVDISHTSRSIGALVHGMATWPGAPRIGGVVLNKAGSAAHAREARTAIEDAGLPVLGVLSRHAGIEAPSRHLGLVPAEERPESAAMIATLIDCIDDGIDLDAVISLARTAPDLQGDAWDPVRALALGAQGGPVTDPPARPGAGATCVAAFGQCLPAARPVVAIAGGRAFTFRYAETEELLRAAGCEPVTFDPVADSELPPGTCGLYLGGGFPEVHAGELSANASLRSAIRQAVAAGLPTVAECAGLLYLCAELDDQTMVGALPLRAAMGPRLTMGYRVARAPQSSLLGRVGEVVTGHEFHRTTVSECQSGQPGEHLTPADRSSGPAWVLARPGDDTAGGCPDGWASPNVHASYLHVHWAGHPHLVARFVEAVFAAASRHTTSEPDLRHHGDRDIAEGLVDLAVNVRLGGTPEWLRAALFEDLDLSAYPDPAGARQAIAAHHGVDPEMVLPTSGGAEGFTLIARAITGEHPLVVHPQFTEPELALRTAGRRVERLLLRPEEGFTLRAGQVPDRADLVLVGNPTNPTSVLHPANELRSLIRPGRVVVVDEAFMDAVPGESESLIAPQMTGVLVVRSLTKTWGLAGVRAGYLIGDPRLIALAAEQQTHWSVSTLAARAMVACSTPRALAETRAWVDRLQTDRRDLVACLEGVGARVVAAPQAPFVLADTSQWGPRSVREELAREGFAVRRGESFPGLGEDWIRTAVREPHIHAELAQALGRMRRNRES